MFPARLATVILGLCLMGQQVRGQSLSGSILGAVTDVSGAVFPGAQILIRNLATNEERSVRASLAGDYEVLALPVGSYIAVCAAPGFRPVRRTGLTLRVNQRLRADFVLAPGAVDERVEVTAAVPLVDTDSATQGLVVDNRRIVELPLDGRNFRQLASLAPGVVAPPPGSGDRFAVAGVRGTSNSFMLDGATNSQPDNDTFVDPSIDLIEEFKIQRNSFSAEYGRGAAQINVVTKSGTNALRLTLFEFLRNERIQARNFFDGSNKPALRRNQFGGTVGGPIVRNRAFWLFNFEGVRQRSPATLLGGFPTPSELDGDLAGRAVRDPFTRQPFPGSRIPASRIDRTTRLYREFVPLTTLPLGAIGRGQNFVKPVSGASDSDQLTIKLDHALRAGMNVFARFTSNQPDGINRRMSELWDSASTSDNYNAVAGWTFVPRANIVNELRGSWGRTASAVQPRVAATYPRNFAQILDLANTISGSQPEANALPTVNITGFTAMGGPSWSSLRLNTYSVTNNLSWVFPRHSVKWGVDVRRELVDQRNIGATNGSFTFAGFFSGQPLGDYLLGLPQTATATSPPGLDGVNLGTLWQAFAQDDWKVSQRLTISYGVRWEYAQPFVNDRDRISRFDTGFPGGRLVYPGDERYFVPGPGFLPSETGNPLASRGLYTTSKKNFAPRFGFAWRPFSGNRTAVRGNYGIYSETPNGLSYAVSVNNTPHLLRQSVVNDAVDPRHPWSALFPSTPIEGTLQIGTVAARLPAGYLQQWGLNLQRQIARSLVLEGGYMGNKGTRLDQTRNINQARLDTDRARPSPIPSRLPYPAFSPNLVYYDRTGSSNYHAFVARLEREFSRGLSLLASYTFSKTIDNSSFRGSIGAQPAFPQNSYDLGAERGLSYFDAPHRFVASWVWDLPAPKRWRWLGGWQSVGIFQNQTGNPWSIAVAGDWPNVGAGNPRADQIGNPYPTGFRRGGAERLAFSPGAFALPPRGAFGNTGRNIVRDAPQNNWDLGLFRNFVLGDRWRLQLRAESFNAFNHTQFQQFGNVVNTPSFATWNSARPPRIWQFGLKLVH